MTSEIDNKQLRKKAKALVEIFKHVFGNDWYYTKACINSGSFIKDTFIEPGVDDEYSNWWNREALLDAFRDLELYLHPLPGDNDAEPSDD